ncbi:NUDIX domain-containing protein [Corynebacterium sp. J010B-136]|uniref:NUDIX hydrolase n=1 Tax=Corynebacterium sp. J010B-136 TaxID=2099401 RepID=UPI000CFA0306|nr:NUDIX domain-containing protein [Corynebacterium sp. J010B-136]PQM73463.1 NUDIX hydrolase [Corynebacterium sp. J010B-136]
MVLPSIHVSAVVFRDEQDKVLTVRKRGTSKFMFPGGKPESGESAVETAIREVKEEIGVGVEPECLTRIGVFEAPAANEAQHTVIATVFSYDGDPVSPQMAAEIAELSWVAPNQPDIELAPLLADYVFPVLDFKVS